MSSETRLLEAVLIKLSCELQNLEKLWSEEDGFIFKDHIVESVGVVNALVQVLANAEHGDNLQYLIDQMKIIAGSNKLLAWSAGYANLLNLIKKLEQ